MPRRRPGPDTEWASWALLTALLFTLLEGAALRSGSHERTLSATTRRWLGIQPVRWYRPVGSALFFGVLAWIGVHIVVQVPDEEPDRDSP